MDQEKSPGCYCKKCGAPIDPTDEKCPNGHVLKDVGRHYVVVAEEKIEASADLKAVFTVKQLNIIERVYRVIKDKLASKEIESITFGFPQLISIKIINKKE